MRISAVFFSLFLLVAPMAMATNGNTGANTDARIGLRAINETKARPNLPGDLIIEFGFNFIDEEFQYIPDPSTDSTVSVGTGFWGSKVVNMYYSHTVFLGGENSGLTFNPGLGLALEKFAFEDDFTLTVNEFDNNTELMPIGGLGEIKKTKLALTYLDIPLEIRYHFNKSDYSRGIRLAAGVKGGLLLASHTKVKFENDEETVKTKDKREFNLNAVRYGVFGRLGIGGFNVYYYHGLNDIFKDGETPGAGPAVSPFQVGISLVGF
ncbi:porin family protein [Roseivirga sp. BDSF3-8]|uniref:porin family protein n=1 Tax=Roseivirga sp. BDSF3-8 TaxID=3241598 RepID=UPI003531A9CD